MSWVGGCPTCPESRSSAAVRLLDDRGEFLLRRSVEDVADASA